MSVTKRVNEDFFEIPTGLSDPYCMLCVIKDGQGDKVSDNGNKIKKKLLRQFVDEKDVKLTKIVMKTLNPEWNQHFKLLAFLFSGKLKIS